jgi:hypothetical protein
VGDELLLAGCGRRVVTCGLTDGHDEPNIRFYKFFEQTK